VLGGVFLVVVLFLPRGIIPTGGELVTRFRTRGRAVIAPATAIGPAGTPPAPSSVGSGGAQ
jgi:hypothetical protein